MEGIKKTEDLRVRTLAASLLAKAGNDGVSMLKKEAVLGGAAEERARVRGEQRKIKVASCLFPV